MSHSSHTALDKTAYSVLALQVYVSKTIINVNFQKFNYICLFIACYKQARGIHSLL